MSNEQIFDSEQYVIVKQLIDSLNEINSEHRIGLTNKIRLTVDTGDVKPVKQCQYLISTYMLKILNEDLDEMLKLGVVEPSHSSWHNPVLLVKKSSNEYRLCLYIRNVN